jgi:hypothetical protein
MSTTHTPEVQPKKLLIITSSGGGGLIQTANAKEQQALAKDPNLVIVRVDLLKDWVWGPFGNFCINFWNKAQVKGNIFIQQICVWGQSITDYFLHPTIFLYSLYTIFKEDIDYVIDTQALGTSAIIKAIRIFNRKRNKNVKLEKVLVDLPTRKATHFFRSIKHLSPKSRKFIQLTSIEPLLENGESAENFWQETCGLSVREVNYEDPYVRKAFIPYKGKARSQEIIHLSIHYKNNEEFLLQQKTLQRGESTCEIQKDLVTFSIDPQDIVVTILLGSQPAHDATLSYLRQIIGAAKTFRRKKIKLFVFCADHVEGKESLFKKAADLVEKVEDYPKNLTVIPFSFQKEDVIAPLFFRSNATCTRSGGQTAMELISVSTGEKWIHSEAPRNTDLLKGMPSWESASAVYLQKMHGARIVSTETIHEHLDCLFRDE